MKCKVLVFGGTTEGRILSDILRESQIPHEVSVATDYGGRILSERGEQDLIVGRKDAREIRTMIEEGGFSIVVDATHPFATVVSGEIKAACEKARVPYVRLKRDTGYGAFAGENIICANSLEDAITEIKKVHGNVLLLTGSKDLEQITGAFSDVSRLYARVLPNVESIEKCSRAGLAGRQIIAMQGPFSKQMNVAVIREISAKAILTKESGKFGGLSEKLAAAEACGITAVVIANPENSDKTADGYVMEEVLKILSEHTGCAIDQHPTVTFSGNEDR